MVSSRMTVAEHIDCTLCSCAQTVYALKTSRAHGMNAECLNNVFIAIILAKLMARVHGSRASKSDRIEAFIRQCKHSGLCSEDTATFAE